MHISYKPLWHTLIERNMRKEDLRLAAGLTTNMIANMGKGKHISMETLTKICETLNCGILDVIELVQDSEDVKQEKIDNRFYSVGIDGCKKAWLTAAICDGKLKLYRFDSLNELTDALPFDTCLIDMVIGLQGNERQIRPDGYARKILKGRASTVFPAPCRKAVYEITKEQRISANVEVLNKKFTSQTDALIPKMREVDEFLQSYSQYKNVIQESHPEVCFTRLKGNVLFSNKHSPEGIRERADIIAEYIPDVTTDWISSMAKKMKCNEDDVTDSVCLAIVANLLAQGKTETIPAKPMMDDTGLLMQMVIPREE